jgi:formylglycine-generating enzyme required for sulfatase activity
MRGAAVLSLFLILLAPVARAAPGMVSVTVQPADAEIWIDGAVETLPPSMQKTVVPGLHEIAIYKKDYVIQSFEIRIAPGMLTTVAVSLRLKDTPIASPVPVFRDCQDRDSAGHFLCPEMVVIPPGSFIMGSPEREIAAKWLTRFSYPVWMEQPQHRVTIADSVASTCQTVKRYRRQVRAQKKPSAAPRLHTPSSPRLATISFCTSTRANRSSPKKAPA